MTTTTRPLAPGDIVATPHQHRGHCQRWSRCDGAQTGRIVRFANTYADVVTACGYLMVISASDVQASA